MVKRTKKTGISGEKGFAQAELKLLIGAVYSSKFFTQSKSQSLARKIISLTGKHEQNELKHNIYATNCIKSNNECPLYIIDTVNDVIYSKNKIAFQCYDYTLEKILKNDGEIYTLSLHAFFRMRIPTTQLDILSYLKTI